MISKSNIKHVMRLSATVILIFVIFEGTSHQSNNLKVEKSVWPVYLPPTFGHFLQNYNTSLIPKDEENFVKRYLPEMMDRVQSMSNYCLHHPELGVTGRLSQLAWIRRTNKTSIVWCPNVKVGSGTWTANFLREAHFNENNPRILALPFMERDEARFDFKYGATFGTLRKLFPLPKTPQEKRRIFSNALRLIVVRHPFTRVLSAYRNKIQVAIPTAKDERFYSKIRTQILQKYRNGSNPKDDDFPTFQEFVEFIIDSTAVNTTKTYNGKDTQVSLYWEPFWSHCRVCASDYSIIIKLENMAKDEKFLAIVANLAEIKKKRKMEWRHMRKQTTSFNLVGRYFRQLTKAQLLQLYRVYEPDFEMFGYTIDEYLHIVNERRPNKLNS